MTSPHPSTVRERVKVRSSSTSRSNRLSRALVRRFTPSATASLSSSPLDTASSASPLPSPLATSISAPTLPSVDQVDASPSNSAEPTTHRHQPRTAHRFGHRERVRRRAISGLDGARVTQSDSNLRQPPKAAFASPSLPAGVLQGSAAVFRPLTQRDVLPSGRGGHLAEELHVPKLGRSLRADLLAESAELFPDLTVEVLEVLIDSWYQEETDSYDVVGIYLWLIDRGWGPEDHDDVGVLETGLVGDLHRLKQDLHRHERTRKDSSSSSSSSSSSFRLSKAFRSSSRALRRTSMPRIELLPQSGGGRSR